MKRVIVLLLLFWGLLSAFPALSQSDTTGYTSQLLIELDASLSQVEQMLSNTEIELSSLREELTRSKTLLAEALKYSVELSELYERLLQRYNDAVGSFLILEKLYRWNKIIMIGEGVAIVVLSIALAMALLL